MVKGWVKEGGRDLSILFKALEAREAVRLQRAQAAASDGDAMDVDVEHATVEEEGARNQNDSAGIRGLSRESYKAHRADIREGKRKARALDKRDGLESLQQMRGLLKRLGMMDDALITDKDEEGSSDDEVESEEMSDSEMEAGDGEVDELRSSRDSDEESDARMDDGEPETKVRLHSDSVSKSRSRSTA